jgi:hypothetical protein
MGRRKAADLDLSTLITAREAENQKISASLSSKEYNLLV